MAERGRVEMVEMMTMTWMAHDVDMTCEMVDMVDH